ncbi:MAG: TlpA disulfide reductase family protein [Dictyoglomaceae bacterium]
MSRKLLLLFLLTFSLFSLLEINLNKKLFAEDLELDSPAINFTLPNIKGENYSLNQFRRKVVLLNFWATWCSPCKEEILILNKIYKSYKKLGFEIIAISLDVDIERVKNFLRENNISFLVLLDKKGIVGFKYKIKSIPTSFLIDKNQIIRKIYIGIIKEKELVKDLEKWLK